MSSTSLAEYRELFPVKKTKKRCSAKQGTRQPSESELEQFGAWCETVRMKGGDLPDGLHINQIHWLMREADRELPKGKSYIRCE
ncbi:hypothetical protein [Acinetobacter pittii]